MILQFSFLFYHTRPKNSILSTTGFNLSKNICGAFLFCHHFTIVDNL